MSTLGKIKEISDMLHVAPSTLRYWDKEKLLRFERDSQNHYRQFSFQSMMDICDIILYRSLAIPIRELKELPSAGLDELKETLVTNQAQMEEKITEIHRTISKIQTKLEMIEKLEALRQEDIAVVTARFDTIREFRFQDEALVQHYLDVPYDSVIVLKPENSFAVRYGVIMASVDHILRGRDNDTRQYLKGLVKVETENISRHNGAGLIQEAHRRGYTPGAIIGRYLLTAYEGIRYDYYEAFLEIGCNSVQDIL